MGSMPAAPPLSAVMAAIGGDVLYTRCIHSVYIVYTPCIYRVYTAVLRILLGRVATLSNSSVRTCEILRLGDTK